MTNTEELIWFMDAGRELKGKAVSDYLSARIPLLLGALNSVQVLNKRISSELDQYVLAGNIINDTLNLCELLSHIEIYCESFLEEYHQLKSDIELI